MVEIQLTQGKVAMVDQVDADLARFRWHARRGTRTWYAVRWRCGPKKSKTLIRLHRVVAERKGLAIQDVEVDHKDGDGLNCRRVNIRRASHGQNGMNRRRGRNNKSGHKGVSWVNRDRRWRACIQANGKPYRLGDFTEKGKAIAAYREAAARLHGEFARTA